MGFWNNLFLVFILGSRDWCLNGKLQNFLKKPSEWLWTRQARHRFRAPPSACICPVRLPWQRGRSLKGSFCRGPGKRGSRNQIGGFDFLVEFSCFIDFFPELWEVPLMGPKGLEGREEALLCWMRTRQVTVGDWKHLNVPHPDSAEELSLLGRKKPDWKRRPK